MSLILVLLGLLPQSADPRPHFEPYTGPYQYGLAIVPPWTDGGRLVVNLPEHLEYESRGMGILRHNDKKRTGTWEITPDGASATLDVESTTAPGVRVTGKASVAGADRIEITMRIFNGGKIPLPDINPLYCFHYRHLKGFPQWVDNFKHTYVLSNGKPVALADVRTEKPDAKVKGGTVAGCAQKGNGFARRNGGLIESGLDAAVAAVTALDGRRKMLVSWAPGKSILSNANIPCLHADPYYGTIAPGAAAEATGVIRFTEGKLAEAMAEASGRGKEGLAARYPGDAGIAKDPDVILVESFESDSWKKTWQEISHPEYKVIDSDHVVDGNRSLRLNITPEAGKTGAGWMSHWWEGGEEVYLRYYFRLSRGGDWSNNKLFQLHGRPRGVRYGPGAGKRPTGFNIISAGTGVGGKSGPPWDRIILYTYWPHQKGNWGDNVPPLEGLAPRVHEEEWTCYEVMVKLNQVGKADGIQRLWLNGKLIIEQTGMEWRKTDNLLVNNLFLASYTHAPPKRGTERAVWLDALVMARRYIGPRTAKVE